MTKPKATLGALALLGAPGAVFAHHGEERDIVGQLAHVFSDPFHLGVSALVVAGIVGLVALYRRKRKDS